MEELPPVPLQVRAQDVLHALLLVGEPLLDGIPVKIAVEVVVAVDEDLLHGTSVRVAIVREDVLPRLNDGLEIVRKPVVGHVAGDDDRIDVLSAEPLECTAERRVAPPALRLLAITVDIADVNVGHDAEPEVGLAIPAEVRRTDEAKPAERTERRRAANEEPPRHG